jgi:hypothetical protein
MLPTLLAAHGVLCACCCAVQGCQDCKAFAAAEDASAQAELLEEHLFVLSQLAMLMPEEPE